VLNFILGHTGDILGVGSMHLLQACGGYEIIVIICWDTWMNGERNISDLSL
jgi:hypothetical protein